MVCVLFVLYESLQGNYANSQIHMDSGRAIVAQSHRGQGQPHRKHLEEILEVLAHLDVFALTFSDSVAPYHYTLQDLLKTAPNLQPLPFNSINEAHSSLTDLLRWRLVLGYQIIDGSNNGEQAEREHDAAVTGCKKRLSAWRKYWDELLQRYDNSISSSSPHARLVELWYAMACVNVNAGFSGPETRYDTLHLQGYFSSIVELGESLSYEVNETPATASFSLGLGFVMPTFFCAIRCRHPQLRRRAIRTLQVGSRREGPWESTAAAAIATRWMEREEAGLEGIREPEDVPESQRIAVLYTKIDARHSSARLRFVKSIPTDSNEEQWSDDLRWSNANESSHSYP
jgi:hypothetical protein